MSVLQAKVTTKGQITLPKAVRDQLSIQTGDRIEFSVDQANKVSIHRMQPAGSSAGCAKPFLKPKQKRLTREEEKAGMLKKIGEKYAAHRVS